MNKLSDHTRFNANDKVATEIWSTKQKVPRFLDQYRCNTMLSLATFCKVLLLQNGQKQRRCIWTLNGHSCLAQAGRRIDALIFFPFYLFIYLFNKLLLMKIYMYKTRAAFSAFLKLCFPVLLLNVIYFIYFSYSVSWCCSCILTTVRWDEATAQSIIWHYYTPTHPVTVLLSQS